MSPFCHSRIGTNSRDTLVVVPTLDGSRVPQLATRQAQPLNIFLVPGELKGSYLFLPVCLSHLPKRVGNKRLPFGTSTMNGPKWENQKVKRSIRFGQLSCFYADFPKTTKQLLPKRALLMRRLASISASRVRFPEKPSTSDQSDGPSPLLQGEA